MGRITFTTFAKVVIQEFYIGIMAPLQPLQKWYAMLFAYNSILPITTALKSRFMAELLAFFRYPETFATFAFPYNANVGFCKGSCKGKWELFTNKKVVFSN